MTSKSLPFFLLLCLLFAACFQDCYSSLTFTGSSEGDKLYSALMDGNASLTEKLLKKKIDPNRTTLTGEALISTATSNPEILKLYIKYGANIENEGTSGRTPLEYALLNCHFEGARILISSGAKTDSLNAGNYPILFQIIARKVYPSNCSSSICIDSLVSFGIDLNYQDNNGNTPLMIAVYRENMEATKALLKHGVRKTTINKRGLSAQDIAADNQNDSLVNMLTE